MEDRNDFQGNLVKLIQYVYTWRREWLLTPVFLPGEFHGQRSLTGHSPWGGKESDTTERLPYTIH